MHYALKIWEHGCPKHEIYDKTILKISVTCYELTLRSNTKFPEITADLILGLMQWKWNHKSHARHSHMLSFSAAGVWGELTVPYIYNIQKACGRKYTKYTEFKVDCLNRGFYLLAIHLRSDADVLFQQKEVTRSSKKAEEAAETGTAWIWSKYVQKR